MKVIVNVFEIVLLLFLVFACSSSDEEETGADDGYANFSESEISVSCQEGKSSAIVVWSDVEWEIQIEEDNTEDNGFITNISPSSGGEIGGSDLTTISFSVSENNTASERSLALYVVNKETQEKQTLVITQETYPIDVVTSTTKYQKVVGFGGMYTVDVWGTPEISSDELAKMYNPTGDLKYSILRLMIYADESRWVEDVEGALEAQNYGATIFACPWDCTVALDDTIKVDGESMKHLPSENYDAYADHLIEYVEYMQSQGVSIYAISVQNEPDMSFTYWTPDEIKNFTANYGAKIRAAGVKLISPEACGFQPEYTDAIINSTAAFANTDIVAGHLYQGFTDLTSSYVKSRHDYVCSLYPNTLEAAGKTWWMTEKLFGSYGEDRESGEYKKWSYSMDNLALEMHMCMEGYCSAYVYWYLKRFYGMISDNSEYAYENEGTILKNGYIMGHYSAYASDMTRVDINVLGDDIYATAYVNDEGNVVAVVALNFGIEEYESILEFSGDVSSCSAIETTEDYNMKSVETSILEDGKHVKIRISPSSIYSIEVKM